MAYTKGMPYDLRFGGKYGEDQFGVCLYGDANHPAAGWAMEAATAEHPAQAALSDHQKLSFWFRFADIRPYGQVRDLFDKVVELLEQAGWKMAPAIEGLPDTGSSIGRLVDTTWGPEYRDETEFPPEPSSHGYNAAKEFVVVVERKGTRPEFSPEEIETIQGLARQAGRMVFGRELAEEVEYAS